jgi:hypothetical protein
MANQNKNESESDYVEFQDVTEDSENNNASSDNDEVINEVPDDNTADGTSLSTIPTGELTALSAINDVDTLKLFATKMGIPGSPASVAQRLARAIELKVGYMQGLDNIYIINGRATLSVWLFLMLIKRAGYELRTIRDNEYLLNDGTYSKTKPTVTDPKDPKFPIDRVCELEWVWRSKITGEVERERYSYYWSEAVAAKHTDKATWKQYSKQMLWKTTAIFGSRRICAEAVDMYEYGEMADAKGIDYKVSETGNCTPIDITPKN